MTPSDAPEISHTPDNKGRQGRTGPSRWEETPFVRELSSGVKPSPDPVSLDAETAREVNRKLREIEESRAAAAVSGRDYLIR